MQLPKACPHLFFVQLRLFAKRNSCVNTENRLPPNNNNTQNGLTILHTGMLFSQNETVCLHNGMMSLQKNDERAEQKVNFPKRMVILPYCRVNN